VIKTQNHTTWQNSWSYVTIRELQARKTQSIFCNKNVFCERQDSEETNISRYQNRDTWVLLKLNSVSRTPKPLKTTQRSWNFKKNCQERGDRSLISHPSLPKNSSQNVLKLELFNRFYIWYFETNISFQNSNTQTSFLKAPTMIKHES